MFRFAANSVLLMLCCFAPHIQCSHAADAPADLVERVKKSVVVIEAIDRNGQKVGRGSGFAVEKGIIATNRHVLEAGSRFKVTRNDGRSVVVTGIWCFDSPYDLALVQLSEPDGNGDIPSLPLATDESVRVGQPIYVIGHPENLQFTVSNGIVSAMNRRLNEIDPEYPKVEAIQTDAASAQGSSGGPWINHAGEVVGVHRAGLVRQQGFNFATHVRHLRALVQRERTKMLRVDHFNSKDRLTRSWRVLVPPDGRGKGNLWFTPLKELTFAAPEGKHLIGQFAIDGSWELVADTLIRAGGSRAAVSFGVVDDFVLDGKFEFGREGGSFLLLGWNDGSGYLIYEPGLRAVTTWGLLEMNEGKFVEGSGKSLSNAKVRGTHPVKITVESKRLTVQFGPHIIAEDVPLPKYQEGSLILGTYPSGYGPRPIRILAARIRAQ